MIFGAGAAATADGVAGPISKEIAGTCRALDIPKPEQEIQAESGIDITALCLNRNGAHPYGVSFIRALVRLPSRHVYSGSYGG